MADLNEQQYKEAREKFEKYLDTSRIALEKAALVAETGGYTYDNEKKTVNIEIQGKDPSGYSKEIDVSTPKAYIENLTNAMHEMLANADSLTQEQKNANLESCMRTYLDQMNAFAHRLSTMEIAPGQEMNISGANPIFQELRNTARDLPDPGNLVQLEKGFTQGDLDGRDRKCKDDYYCAMMKDPDFCKQAIKRAQNNLKTLSQSRTSSNSDEIQAKAVIVQREADIVILGKRIQAEQKNAEMYYNNSIKPYAREMCKPNPIFDPQVKTEDYERTSYAHAILEAASASKEFSAERMGQGFNYKMPEQMYEKLGKTFLSPKSEQGANTLNHIYQLGKSSSLEIGQNDMKALSGKGSPEYTALHNAFRDYLFKQRCPGKSTAQEETSLYKNARDYLFKKKSRPITQDGKDRVEGAVKLFTKLSLQKLAKMPNDSDSRKDVIAALKLEMLRNPTCRQLVSEELGKEGSKVAAAVSDDLKKFSREVGNHIDEHGIALHGKVEHPRQALEAVSSAKSVGEMLDQISGKAPEAPQNSMFM